MKVPSQEPSAFSYWGSSGGGGWLCDFLLFSKFFAYKDPKTMTCIQMNLVSQIIISIVVPKFLVELKVQVPKKKCKEDGGYTDPIHCSQLSG